ncbi:MAG: hypothetical protein ACRDKC_00120 [Gaiellaceae bacterium]
MHEREIKPVWTSSSFLVYTGGLTVLFGGIFALVYLWIEYHGGGARTAWALLIFVVLLAIAEALRRVETWVAAGIFAFVSVIAWGLLLGSAWHWAGWLKHWDAPFRGWSFAHLTLEFLILVVAVIFRRHWRFPFIALISTAVGWFFVTDFISGGGTWTYIVTLFIGLLYLAAGTIVSRPSAFWLHFVGGLLIGVPIFHWFDKSDGDFAVVLIVSVLFVLIAYATRRSSWAVFATFGFFAATNHYIAGSPTGLVGGIFGVGGGQECTSTPTGQICRSLGPSGPSPWSPALGFGLLGFWLVFLGLLGRRRRAAVAPAPPAAPAPE